MYTERGINMREAPLLRAPVHLFDAPRFAVDYNTKYGIKSIERKSPVFRGFFWGIKKVSVSTTAALCELP